MTISQTLAVLIAMLLLPIANANRAEKLKKEIIKREIAQEKVKDKKLKEIKASP